ncbi:hypothetical protein JD292_08995 [Leucobacter sp. CSA2]|uniref:DUF1023 domain-containing protein n=1 Tax=Leucobacter edaphi TaxID=2796472 RepID=A0A934UXN1_9MICO|nr:hypothetical protein [Leucobacter edaphi]
MGENLIANIESSRDPEPSDPPVAAPTISASFSVKPRYRTAGAALPGKSSADPTRLNGYVAQSRTSNSEMEAELSSVKNAWSSFTGSCSWVRIESTTFLTGFQELLDENRQDAEWIDGVAAAFEAAGGGKLSNRVLDLTQSPEKPLPEAELLNALEELKENEIVAFFAANPSAKHRLQDIDPATVHSWWQRMNPAKGSDSRFSAQQQLLLDAFPEVMGNLEGVAYGARDYANRRALTAELKNVRAEIEELRAGGSNTEKLETQLRALENVEKSLRNPQNSESRFLISLTQDQPPLAAVSIGDLDTASKVSYAAPGMGTDTTGMMGWTNAAQNLHRLLPRGSAVVAWIGYETPPVPEVMNLDLGVLDSDRAVAGGNRLAATLRGLTATRGESMPQLDIVAHSYGTTTAAVSLTLPGAKVDNFITLGSAGLPDNITRADHLQATHVYSGHARDRMAIDPESGDEWAWVGRDFSANHHVNPMLPDFGGQPFGVDTGGDAGDPVVGHDPLIVGGGGYFDERTESLANIARIIGGDTDLLTNYVPLGPTNLQEGMRESVKVR